MDLRNFKFDTRLNGIDQNGNPIRGKKKKKKYLRQNPADERRREEAAERDSVMRFSLNGVYYESTAEEDDETTEVVEETAQTNDGENRRNDNNRDKKNRRENDNTRNNGKTIDECIEELAQFVTTYSSNKINTPVAKTIVANGFASVANIMSHYTDDSWKKALPEMNKVIILMSSENFSRILKIVLSEGSMVTTKTSKEDIMRLFNVVLDHNIDRMSDDVITTYVEIVSTLIADIDIKLLMETYGMDEDTALNFVISIPVSVTGVKNDSDIKQYARRFIDEVLRESESTITYMDAECQKKLFYNIFNDKRDIGAMKAVGQCMTSSEIIIHEEYDEENKEMVVDPKKVELVKQYIEALYQIMDDHDIPTIQMVLKFIVKELKKRDEEDNNVPIVFDVRRALEYSNIRKAILDLTENNEDARTYLDEDAEYEED